MLMRMDSGYLSINQLLNRINALTTEAALIAGFAFTGLSAVNEADLGLFKFETALAVVFTVTSMISIMLNIIALITGTFIAQVLLSADVHPDDYKNLHAVAGTLRLEFLTSFWTFMIGLFFFMVAAVLLAWARMGDYAAIAALVVSVFGGVALLFQSVRTFKIGDQYSGMDIYRESKPASSSKIVSSPEPTNANPTLAEPLQPPEQPLIVDLSETKSEKKKKDKEKKNSKKASKKDTK